MFQGLRKFINDQAWLDTIGEPLQKELASFYSQGGERGPRKKLQNFLNGVWLGHPLHPMLTDVPVGAWTATVVLDAVASMTDTEALEVAADITLVTGLVAALGAAASGITDWMDTYGEERTVGLLHGLTMLSTTLLYSQSLVSRLTGSRKAGVSLSTIGYALLSAGAYLGGDEVYDLGYPINHVAFDHAPSDFVPVMPEADVPAGQMVKASANNLPVLLARVNDSIYCLHDTCVHAGCSLSGGKLDGLVVTCPCHGSQYDIRDGSVLNGPATMPEPHYAVRVNNGMVEVKGA
jgi:nitrite reductase/ring-hydroxylating ferredoxin subunit/uncharacterized membrane protein